MSLFLVQAPVVITSGASRLLEQAHIHTPQIRKGQKDDLSVSTLYPRHAHTPLCGEKK